MTTINLEKNSNTFIFSGGMAREIEQMKRDCCGRYDNPLFGDASKIITQLQDKKRNPMTQLDVRILCTLGVNKEYYNKIYCYYCVNMKNYKNYTFSPYDGENKDNDYSRLRQGVLQFSKENDFNIYIINCA